VFLGVSQCEFASLKEDGSDGLAVFDLSSSLVEECVGAQTSEALRVAGPASLVSVERPENIGAPRSCHVDAIVAAWMNEGLATEEDGPAGALVREEDWSRFLHRAHQGDMHTHAQGLWSRLNLGCAAAAAAAML
jgi:hypothetical protein